MPSAPEPSFDLGDGSREPRIIRPEKPHFAHQQEPRLHVVAAKTVHETAAARVPGVFLDDAPHLRGPVLPDARAVRKFAMRGDPGQPVAGRPAHERR